MWRTNFAPAGLRGRVIFGKGEKMSDHYDRYNGMENLLNTDCISRQAAIDAILHITNCKSVRELFEYNQEHHLTEMWSGGVNDAIDAVIGVESATDNNVGTKHGTNLASLGTDCISRQQAIDIAKDLTITVEGYEMHNQAVMNYCADIMQLPPIQPKRGKWNRLDMDTLNCNKCGATFVLNQGSEKMHFCPNCGADMRGEQE